ncbi:MAG: hypothetical protein ACI8P9_000084 [Parasphingorhabdus sp.]|jgi:hypothetical protein
MGDIRFGIEKLGLVQSDNFSTEAKKYAQPGTCMPMRANSFLIRLFRETAASVMSMTLRRNTTNRKPALSG